MRARAKAGLVILDGAGLAAPSPGNVVDRACMPVLFDLFDRCGMVPLRASGDAVGLFDGQAGNSEVGHLTLGMGRTVVSSLVAIDGAYRSGAWEKSPVWRGLRDETAQNGRIHILGLVSDAGVHGHWRTIVQAAELAGRSGFSTVIVHPVLDGVDAMRGSGPALLDTLRQALAARVPGALIGVVIGRAWFADRSGNRALARHLVDALMNADALPRFDRRLLDDFCRDNGERDFPAHRVDADTRLTPGEAMLVTSHRADRAEQTVEALAARCRVATLTSISPQVPAARVFFPTRSLSGGLAQALRARGIALTRIAENCKFPHVTYFFNGFRQSLGERQVAIPDTPGGPEQNPLMRADETVDACRQVMTSDRETGFVVNIPNLDQVGHSGDVGLCRQAAAAVDRALAALVAQARETGWTLAVTADHGNAERLLDDQGRGFGSHTTNPVPFTIVAADGGRADWAFGAGGLDNVAPTMAALLGVDPAGIGDAPALICRQRSLA
ncbi:MAG: hypothetical protein RIB97_08510 [Nitratireductor sp.]